MVQVKINDGVLEGELLDNEYGGKFYSFKGIPYAAPPVGDLRFKAPQPVSPWRGVRKATEHGPIAYQAYDLITRTVNPLGSEDCLYLNVYSPEIKPKKPLPVMVYIHGGGFLCGSGNDDVYGPEFLVKEGVILVTFNYRLEALGFLCLDTEDIPGNAGMKDQVAALRWVKNNINNFGGDPNNVTIFGESAGGASVSFHLISPMSKGLFQRAIVQSGTGNNPWAMPFQPREIGLRLAKNLGHRSEDDKELFEFLKSVPVTKLSPLQLPFTTSESVKPSLLYFGVVSEKKFGNNERFFHGNVNEAVRNGIHDGVEVMIGNTSDEGLMTLSQIPLSNFCDKINTFADYLTPTLIQYNCKLADQIEAAKSVKKFYFGKDDVTEEKWETILKNLDFQMFNHGTLQWAKFSANQNRKTYLYKFTCKSERNVFAHLLGLGKVIGMKPVTCHADDLAYLFPEKLFNHQPLTDSTKKLVDNVTRLWTNFAKFGNPTPDEALGVKWTPFSVDKEEYLNIGNTLSMEEQPDKEQAQFWDDLYRKYVPEHVFSKF